MRPSLPPHRARTPQVAHTTPDIFIGTTTMRDDYRQWAFPERHTKAEQNAPKPTKFHGVTTTRSDYNWPKELAPPAVPPERPPHVVPKFGGTTEYRAAYELVRAPPCTRVAAARRRRARRRHARRRRRDDATRLIVVVV